jgi:hypothetical protein
MNSIETGQAIVKHETPTDSTSSISNPKIRAEINYRLGNELNEIILSPIMGVQKIRKVLNRFSLDIPALYDLEPEGDEVVIEMDQFGKVKDAYDMPQLNHTENETLYYLYLLYYLTDHGHYDFYVELTDEEGIEEIMKADDELEEESSEDDV